MSTAAGARFISLAEYDPRKFHPNHPFDRRLAALNASAKSWKLDNRKGPLRQIQKNVKTEVDFTLAHVVRKGKKVNIATPICQKLFDMIKELEAGKRQLDIQNYVELRAAGTP